MQEAAPKLTPQKVKRLLEMIDRLRGKERTVNELQKLLGRSHSTLHRDLNDLISLEIGVIHENDRYTIAPRPGTLTGVEALATHAALRLMYHHSPDRPRSYQSALEKLARVLPSGIRSIVQDSIDLSVPPRADDRSLEIIADAWINQHAVSFDYVKPGGSGEARRNEIDVYFVEISRSNLEMYVIGLRRNWEPAIRTYRLTLIRNAMPLKADRYEIPKSFDPRAYLSNAWGVISDQNPVTVRVKLEASVVPWLEGRRFPGVTHAETQTDGSLMYTIVTGTDDSRLPRELIPWIRGWGASIEVLEPPALREKWLADARATLERPRRGEGLKVQ